MKRIIRVFPRRTRATPNDNLVAVARRPGFFDEADEVHISVTFTYDMPYAERLARVWKTVAPVKIGGPATGERSEEFVPGMYLKHGYTITSRGCPNKCWFCSVWKREGKPRELAIVRGWNILDDNLLACSKDHIQNVFSMLSKQLIRPVFTGGLEAARLKDWHINELVRIKTQRMYFAYDTMDDYEPLQAVVKPLVESGLMAGHKIGVYCLIGFPGDTIPEASRRLLDVYDLGYTPYAMLWMDDKMGEVDKEWRGFQRVWARPICIYRHAWPSKKRILFPKTRSHPLLRNKHLNFGKF